VDPEVHAAGHECSRRDVDATAPAATTRALPRLLDQRFDERLEFVRIDHQALARRARRRGDTHCTPNTVKLL
jgi:hypothetical protein